MLRLMKQKLQDMSALDGVICASPHEGLENTVHVVPKQEYVTFVLHVPVPMSTDRFPESTSSSISSNDCISPSFLPVTKTSASESAPSDLLPSVSDRSSHSSCSENGPTQLATQAKEVDTKIQTKTKSREKVKCRKLALAESDPKSSTQPLSKRPRLNDEQRRVGHKLGTPLRAPDGTLLLARTNDSEVLSPLHVFVRRQIEVFTATQSEISQPAPGRKNRIKMNQVGLRCMHCKNLSPRERVKRAVCYPSSLARVYHSVSDMKFDHFSKCHRLPSSLRTEFDALKTLSKRTKDKQSNAKRSGSSASSSSTARYYHDSAREIGMVDDQGGVFMAEEALSDTSSETCCPVEPQMTPSDFIKGRSHSTKQDETETEEMQESQRFHGKLFERYLETKTDPIWRSPSWSNHGAVLLASPLDQHYLNAIHCFVRQHVEVFMANMNDIVAPAPGRKTRVVLGQVGLRCIHCACIPQKDRVKRSICYPPSIAGIYHSMSNMKFDHFGKCKALPEMARETFTRLKGSCKKRGGGSGSRFFFNSTAQYYHDSAVRLGLVDTPQGIRFRERHTAQEVEKVGYNTPEALIPSVKRQEQIPEGMSALMIAAAAASACLTTTRAA